MLKMEEKVPEAILMVKVLQKTMKISTEIIANITEGVAFAAVIDHLLNLSSLWVDHIADLQWTKFHLLRFRNVRTNYLIFQTKREYLAILKTKKSMRFKEERAANQIVSKSRAIYILIIISKHQTISNKNHHHTKHQIRYNSETFTREDKTRLALNLTTNG